MSMTAAGRNYSDRGCLWHKNLFDFSFFSGIKMKPRVGFSPSGELFFNDFFCFTGSGLDKKVFFIWKSFLKFLMMRGFKALPLFHENLVTVNAYVPYCESWWLGRELFITFLSLGIALFALKLKLKRFDREFDQFRFDFLFEIEFFAFIKCHTLCSMILLRFVQSRRENSWAVRKMFWFEVS